MFWAALGVVMICLWVAALVFCVVTVWELRSANQRVASDSELQSLTHTLEKTEAALEYSEWLRCLERHEYTSAIRESRWVKRPFDQLPGR